VDVSGTTFPVLPQHVFFRDRRIIAGLSRYPTTRGQALVVLEKPGVPLFSLDRQDFLNVMSRVKQFAHALRNFYHVKRCALVTEGNGSISIVPLHGLEEAWEPVTSHEKEFQETFPGYVSSKDGPNMDSERMAEIANTIRRESGLKEPLNYHFKGDHGDSNLFARLVRGELSQSRIWEDEEHIAFLTPFANTPGFTVLVPRKHLTSDIFSIEDTDYTNLMDVSYTVAGHLMKAFGVPRCGMIFEGFEIDYAHVKLIPIHSCDTRSQSPEAGPTIEMATYEEKYRGHITSLNGPLLQDRESLVLDASSLRKTIHREHIQPPQSWKNPREHATAVLSESWYEYLFKIQDTLFHSSADYFKLGVNYKYAFVPATTNAISSPMGLGSDSEPVPITLLGQKTYLADSMQFALEYSLRIEDGLKGVYYINTSFRGEDPDAMHLNQFYHVECELAGDFDEGMSVAERYLVSVISALLRDQSDAIEASAGTIEHLTAFLESYQQHDQKLPRVTLENALSLPEMNQTCWNYVVPDSKAHGRTITRVGEQKLIQHFGGAVWLTEMDHLSVPFYQAYVPSTSHGKALCADLLLGNGELLGLGERHVISEEVRTALKQHEVLEEPYKWYLDMRDQKEMKTTGWGMGMERFLAWVLRHNDIRDLVTMPRMKGMQFLV
jgi:beta-aspartyl-peptidase (threonine type)